MIKVKKSSNILEDFNEDKLIRSLSLASVQPKIAYEIVNEIKKKSGEKSYLTSDLIYKKTLSVLKRKERKSALRYSLRKSLLEIGPTGFPFENLIAEIFYRSGYKTSTTVIAKGKCAEHEIDVTAYNSTELIFVEAKYHNDLSIKSDIKVAMYVKARFDDLRDETFDFGGMKMKLTETLLITNTKFSEGAKKYARCAGLDIVSWDYPEKENLYNLIEKSKTFPITCLTSLNKQNKKDLIESGIISCLELLEKKTFLSKIGIFGLKADEILEEAALTCIDN